MAMILLLAGFGAIYAIAYLTQPSEEEIMRTIKKKLSELSK
jgi:hypothetical protein